MWLTLKKYFLFFLFTGAAIMALSFTLKFVKITKPILQTVSPSSSPLLSQPYLVINNAKLKLELALTPEEQVRGLSGHAPLTEDSAMIFVYSPSQKVVFWMKDMTFAIDIIYIANNKVVQIYADIPPPPANTATENLERYPSNQPVDYVLETVSGFSSRNQLQVGSKVAIFR